MNLLCTFSSLSISLIRNGFQTTEQYSSRPTGRTYVLKAAIKDEIFLDAKHRKIKLAFLCALTHNYIRYMSREFKSRVYSYAQISSVGYELTQMPNAVES